jgi:hypothetical protein
MNLLNIKTYHDDIFVTNTIDVMKDSKTYKISPFFSLFFSKYHFPWCNMSFSTVLTQHDSTGERREGIEWYKMTCFVLIGSIPIPLNTSEYFTDIFKNSVEFCGFPRFYYSVERRNNKLEKKNMDYLPDLNSVTVLTLKKF